MKQFSNLRAAARRIKRDSMTIYFVARDTRTPVIVKTLAFAVAAYAVSPIDLIPDFIPVLGYLDDVILLPLGILFIIKLAPAEVIASSRQKADELLLRPVSNMAAMMIIFIWLACAVWLGYWFIHSDWRA